MSKVIAVIDKPKNCEECPCFEGGMFTGVCRLEKQTKPNAEKGIPDWCPLREIPKKKDEWITTVIQDIEICGIKKDKFVSGYNACIDEIMRGSE